MKITKIEICVILLKMTSRRNGLLMDEWYGGQGGKWYKYPARGARGGERYGAEIAKKCKSHNYCYFTQNNFPILGNIFCTNQVQMGQGRASSNNTLALAR